MYVWVACLVGELSCSRFQWFLSVQTICQQWSLTLALGWSQCKNGHAERKSCCHKKYTFTLRQSKASTKNSNNSSSLKWTVHLVPFFYIKLVMEECHYHRLSTKTIIKTVVHFPLQMPLSWLLKGILVQEGVFPRTAGAFRCILLCGICIDPWNWTGFPIIDLFREHIDKMRCKTHSTSSRCAACKLNTVERSDDLSNKFSLLKGGVCLDWRL